MPFLTRAPSLRLALLRPPPSTLPRNTQIRFATQDYGSGDGHPAGEKPQQQGKNPSEHIEHPGPAAPKVAQTSSSTGKESHASSTKQDKKTAGEGAQPKILDHSAPGEGEQAEDVKAHNRDMAGRGGSGG